MNKKIFVLVIATLLLLNINIVLAYTDTDGHWAEQNIKNLSLNGIVSGYADGSFKPNKNLTRAELVTIINRIIGNKIQSTKYIPDISSKNWYYTEIRKGIESGFIQGNKDDYVRPDDLITREEAIVMLQRAFVPLLDESVSVGFSDYDEVSEWAKKSVTTFILNKYISGYTDNTIKPKSNVSRAEVVTIISRIIDTYVSYGELKGEVHGNVLVNGDKVRLNNISIDGNLIICEGASNLVLSDVIVYGDLITRREYDKPINHFEVLGDIYDMKPEPVVGESKYSNEEYGISFTIPTGAKVIYINNESKSVNYKTKNLMTVRINHSEDLYFTSFALRTI